jgi:signal transduction histidine kinase
MRSTASAQSPTPLTILTVHWSSESFPGTHELDGFIQEALRSRSDRIDYFAEYLESDRLPGAEASAAFRDYIRGKYQGRRIDLVIAVTDVALEFADRHRADLFPDAPIVFSAVRSPSTAVQASPPGMTGVLIGEGIRETLHLALALHPSTRRVFYVLGTTTDPQLRESVAASLRAVAPHVELQPITEPSIARLLSAVKAVPAGSVILYIRHSQEESGQVMFPSQVVPLVANGSSVPVYGVTESSLGAGVVGGVMTDRQSIGTRIGEMAFEILQGTRPQDIPIDRAPLVTTFDWRQLRRWNIAEASLPAGSVVRFREISAWERYRAAIVVTAGVLLLQSFLIAGLIFERRRRRRAEIETRRNLEVMAHLDRRAAMGELTASLAHELNQPLNAILQNAGVAQMLLTSNTVPPALGEMTDIINDIRKDDIRASEVIRRMRRLLQKHELELQPVNLNEVAEDAVAIVRPDAKSRAVDLEIELADGMRPVMGDRVHLQQVVLNVLMNALDAVAELPPGRRHVRVWTAHVNGDARLAVADNGAGIPANRLTEIFEPFFSTKEGGRGMGMGLAIARGIVEAHSGRMAAENNAGGGATVWFSVPMSGGLESGVQQ